VKLAVGDVVVYATHGVGRIVARGKRVVGVVGEEIVVFELARGLTVTLPLERAYQLLRPPVDEADLCRVQRTLREAGTLSGDVWLKRRKDTQAKLKGGDPVELAEVVRDGAQRGRVGCVNSVVHHKTFDLQARPSLRTPQAAWPAHLPAEHRELVTQNE
jgi:RNA polymerase-interacting CarD/CdnL/TRCF family regulator